MFIESIILNNFRIYKGKNAISFTRTNGNNIFLIAGDNGFGKTTFLTSLVWCLYGRLMAEVDDKFKKDLNESQGYKNYSKANLNNDLLKQLISIDIPDKLRKKIIKNGYDILDNEIAELESISSYSVTIIISNVFIPSVPCETISITRSYDVLREIENVEILIDNQINELTKEVGADIFINDFILSKDIAKFFFFDAEKIVSLAEMRSIDEKRKLSTAYSEVLGIKKYEDLKNNLENLRIRFRRKSSDIADREKLDAIITSISEIEIGIFEMAKIQQEIDVEIKDNRILSEQYQEKLIREGNSISLEELITLKEERDKLISKDLAFKSKLKELLELAPFAIAGSKLIELKQQIDKEQDNSTDNSNFSIINSTLVNVRNEIKSKIKDATVSKDAYNTFNEIIETTFNKLSFKEHKQDKTFKILVDYTKQELNEFQALFDNIRYSYNQFFKQIVKEDKNNRISLNKTIKKISQAESNENDMLIKDIRSKKVISDSRISFLEIEGRKTSEKLGLLKKELANKTKQMSELSKRISLDDSDRQKDMVAGRIIDELTAFILKLKFEKKSSLEIRIKNALNNLMHKSDFVKNVVIELDNDIIDICLFGRDGIEINKEMLSKGEQQLYATSILKGLVDESEIEFPFFIDSPLQKFDSKHSKNIITQFYPNVSKQVVIFPLLGKELTEEEYSNLIPNISNVHLIKHHNNNSYFEKIEPHKLFTKI